MSKEFDSCVAEMPDLMKKLMISPLKHWSDTLDLPIRGIYVFFENEKPIYVGRTNRMKARIKEHGLSSSKNNKAPFAFNLAKKEAVEKGIDINFSRVELEDNELFNNLFQQAKKRVSNMCIRVIEVNDEIKQTLFEVYASMELKTMDYNSFDNH